MMMMRSKVDTCKRSALLFQSFWALCLPLAAAAARIEWVMKPRNRAVALGSSVVLSCQANLISETDPFVALFYRWQLDGGNVASQALRLHNNSLFLPQIEKKDLGLYTCHVTSRQQKTKDGSWGPVIEAVSSSALVIESFIESFLIHPVSHRVRMGERVTLNCVTGRSAPAPQVHWLRNGEIFTKGENFTAMFGSSDPMGLTVQLSLKLTFVVSSATYGMFECLAVNNALGKEVKSEQANITYEVTASNHLPVIEWNLPDNLILAEGTKFVLSCPILESAEPARISWYLDGSKVEESKPLHLLANNSLGFLPLQREDGGNYSCRAENSNGVSQSPSVRLIVAYLDLNFYTQPFDNFALTGEYVVLRCDPPDSIPAAAVQWYKDYLPLGLASGRVKVIGYDLHLTSVVKADKGQYYCVAVNNFTVPSSRTSKVATLTVEGPPVMIQPPTSTALVKGALLQLTCLVDVDPTPNTTWQFNGQPLSPDPRISLVNRGQKLSITDVGKQWEGQYTCLSMNKYGRVMASAFITVKVPPISLNPIGNVTVKLGDPVYIHCPVVGESVLNITWFFNGKKEKVLTNSQGSGPAWTVNSTGLFITNVTVSHGGNYTCFGLSKEGNASSTGQLIVNVPPSITQAPPESVTAMIGSSVTLTCQATGSPAPAVHWLFNSTTQLPAGSVLQNTNQILKLPPLGWDSVGVYACVAVNSVGRAQATVLAKMTVPPKIIGAHFPVSIVKIQTSFTLTCNASGLPPPSIQWLHLGQPAQATLDGRVQIPEKGVLFVQYAQKSDSGLYECVAASVAGQANKSGAVDVYGAPTPPVLLSAVPISAKSVYLSWEWSSHNSVSDWMETFQVSFRERASEETTIYPIKFSKNVTRAEVIGLLPGTVYVFSVSSSNDAGVSLPSNVMSAVSLQASPSAPANFHTIKVTSTSATLIWETPASTRGIIRKYQLRYIRIADYQSDFQYVNITEPQFPTQEISLSPLQPFSDYNTQVRAATIQAGQDLWGNYSPWITFQTLQSKPSLPPQFIHVNAIDPYSIQVTWQHIPLLAQNGPIIYYYIVYSNNNETLASGNIRVDYSVTAFTIKGLSPWRYYTVSVKGENQAGQGPLSDLVGITTQPIAPVAAPSIFHALGHSASSLLLTWQALPVELVTCDVTAYIVEYREDNSSTWDYVQVPSNSSLSSSSSFAYILESLQPWTWYECRVAAWTESVSPGLGPFTESVWVRVLEGEPTPVTHLSFMASSSAVILSWQTPVDVRGVLIGYKVTYQAISNGSALDEGKILPAILSTSVNIPELLPDMVYNISIAAVSGGGVGQAVVVRVSTLPAHTSTASSNFPLVTDTKDTTSINNISHPYHLLGQDSHITQNLASIVAGSIVGAIAFAAIAVFICLKCMKYRQKQRLNYVVSTDSVDIEGNSYRPLETPTIPCITPSVLVTDSSYKSSQVTDSESSVAAPSSSSSFSSAQTIAATPQSPLSQSAFSARSGQKVEESGNPVKEEKKSPRRLSMPRLSISHNYSKLDEDECADEPTDQGSGGICNPGFIAIKIDKIKDASLSEVESTKPKEQDGKHLSVISSVSGLTESMRRRNRMRSESAAAIAVLRNSQLIFPVDTDVLVDNEIITEVIFHERTVL